MSSSLSKLGKFSSLHLVPSLVPGMELRDLVEVIDIAIGICWFALHSFKIGLICTFSRLKCNKIRVASSGVYSFPNCRAATSTLLSSEAFCCLMHAGGRRCSAAPEFWSFASLLLTFDLLTTGPRPGSNRRQSMRRSPCCQPRNLTEGTGNFAAA